MAVRKKLGPSTEDRVDEAAERLAAWGDPISVDALAAATDGGLAPYAVSAAVCRLRKQGRWRHGPLVPRKPVFTGEDFRASYPRQVRSLGSCATLAEWEDRAGGLIHGPGFYTRKEAASAGPGR